MPPPSPAVLPETMQFSKSRVELKGSYAAAVTGRVILNDTIEERRRAGLAIKAAATTAVAAVVARGDAILEEWRRARHEYTVGVCRENAIAERGRCSRYINRILPRILEK